MLLFAAMPAQSKIVVRDFISVGQKRATLGQGSGFIEDDRGNPCQAFKRRCGLQQDSPAHQTTGGDDLHHRHGQGKRAGAGDD